MNTFTVTPVAQIVQGRAAAPHCVAAVPMPCPRCGARAVLPLDDATQAQQPDETTHVCHPVLDGCNVGFAIIETRAVL